MGVLDTDDHSFRQYGLTGDRLLTTDAPSFVDVLTQITNLFEREDGTRKDDEYMVVICTFAQDSYDYNNAAWRQAISDACANNEWVIDANTLDENTVVSMNLFGFTPDFFAESETLFRKFLSDPANMANPKAEFFIPLCVNQLINDGKVSLKVLNSDAQWFGVTYKQDKPYVVERIQKLIEAGVYPEHLWK